MDRRRFGRNRPARVLEPLVTVDHAQNRARVDCIGDPQHRQFDDLIGVGVGAGRLGIEDDALGNRSSGTDREIVAVHESAQQPEIRVAAQQGGGAFHFKGIGR